MSAEETLSTGSAGCLLWLSVVGGSVVRTMTSMPTLPSLGDCDDPASVLDFARARKAAEDDAGRDVMMAAARWASMHSTDSLVGPVDSWHERALPLGGEGCPEVAEFAVTEFAAMLGRSPASGRRYLAQAVEGAYRLLDCWRQLEQGRLQAWRLGMIADLTMSLPPEAAAFVDHHVAPVAHKIGPAQLMRLVEEAKARFDPEQAEADRLAAAESRKVDIDLAAVGVDGVVAVNGGLDLADALDLESAVADLAHRLLLAGDDSSLDVRRSKALGLLARGQMAVPTDPRPSSASGPGPALRQVVLHVHLSDAALLGAGGLARVDEVSGPVTAEQVRTWCSAPDARVTVRPVIDLAEHIHVDAYETPDRLRELVTLRDVICSHPYCTRKASECDCDHRVDHDDGGPTCTCNLAPACRPHHRAKTTGGWSYVTIEPGVYLWRSPLGYQYLRDHTGTIDVTPDDERRRLASQFLTHLIDPPAEHPPDT